jgi:hypothetical protein
MFVLEHALIALPPVREMIGLISAVHASVVGAHAQNTA